MDVVVAAPRGRLTGLSGFCQSFLDGAPLDDFADEGTLLSLMTRAGQVHARLHGLDVPGVPEWSLKAYAGTIAHDIAFLRHLDLPIAPDLESAWRQLAPRLAEAGGARPVFCHGDFVPGQLLVDAQRIAVTDFDMARRGLDLQEVGKFVASLKYHLPVISRTLGADRVSGEHLLRSAEDAYLAGYEHAIGRRLDRAGLAAFIAAADIHYLGVWAKKDRLPDWTDDVVPRRIAAAVQPWR
jgi:aminoglycoside phosphotransferase (APT) family kinase protein